ncbi:hypothetical protein BRC81_15105 [Halobacteriales archaeon QS_1_68_20]|nr:MAG: hypothetical protein BRC81_15105 [Halobacteriales archaeon QS_1_68_20]
MSDSRSDGPTPRHDRRLIVGSFAALLVLTGTAFAITGTGYFAAEKASGDLVEGTMTDYRVDESGDRTVIVAEIEFENPTGRAVTLESANVDGTVDGTSVARGSTGLEETIPPGETETITVRLTPHEGKQSVAVDAAESGSLTVSGLAWARIERYQFDVDVDPGGGEES